MPEFEPVIHLCPHCGEVLRDPPSCCEAMEQEHGERMHRENDPHFIRDDDLFPEYQDEEDYEPESEECEYCGGTGWQQCNDTIAMECPECGGDGYT